MTMGSKCNLRCYWILFSGLLLSFAFPLRILSHWWLNPILYGLLALVCVFVTFRFISLYHRKRVIMILMVVCIALSVWQSLTSLSEIDNCWVEDNRYTQLFLCDSGGWYQQIETLPIGMQGYCYHCPWYP